MIGRNPCKIEDASFVQKRNGSRLVTDLVELSCGERPDLPCKQISRDSPSDPAENVVEPPTGE